MSGAQVVVKEHDTELVVVLKESSKQIVLVPCNTLGDPLRWVFKRKKDIVDVDSYTRAETRENLEEEVIDVATQLGDVG